MIKSSMVSILIQRKYNPDTHNRNQITSMGQKPSHAFIYHTRFRFYVQERMLCMRLRFGLSRITAGV